MWTYRYAKLTHHLITHALTHSHVRFVAHVLVYPTPRAPQGRRAMGPWWRSCGARWAMRR
jgi:hypothetical protein